MKRPAILVFCALSAPAAVAADGMITASYEVEVKGVTVMKLRYAAEISGSRYAANLVAKTTGMAKWFSEYKIEYSSEGSIAKGKHQTTTFTRERKKNGKKSANGFAWKGGVPQVTAENVDGAPLVQKAVAKGAIDPMALLLNLGLSQAGNPCSGRYVVFDGRDVMETTMSGTASTGSVACKISAKTIAGRSFEQAGDKSDIIDVYAVTFREVDAPFMGRTIYVPWQITGQASGQSFVANMGDLEVSGAPGN